jgi:predicted small metal-binding protein
MKFFSCGDVVPGCDAHWARDSEDDILAAVAEHAVESHNMHSVPADVVDAVRAAIVSG